MKKIITTATIALLFAGSSIAVAGVGNGNGTDKGNKNGWVDHVDGNGNPSGATEDSRVPKGLVVSGENGRVDNGGGNGGENLVAPNNNGEDAAGDQDPN